ncbi:histidine triad nucleotide-binding protein [bacterium]|jgi:histidine triad (HIT) family protein|nr:histidine triad nucleotide-binding protein [bacterium]
MKDCIFCKIIAGQIGAKKIGESSNFLCIEDINPQAPVHLLVMPKLHVASLDAAFPGDEPNQQKMVGELFEFAVKIARDQGLLPSGFRSVINTHSNGGQTVFHLHLHLLGGKSLSGMFA